MSGQEKSLLAGLHSKRYINRLSREMQRLSGPRKQLTVRRRDNYRNVDISSTFRPFASPGSAGVCIPGSGNGNVAVLDSSFCKQSNSYFFIFKGGKPLNPQLEERISTIPMFSLTFAMMSVTSEDSEIRENTFIERIAKAAKRP